MTMGRKSKKPETADAQKKDFVKRNVEAVKKESTVQNFEIRGMEWNARAQQVWVVGRRITRGQ